MYPSLYFCCFVLFMNINYGFGVIDLKVNSDESIKWLKNPLTFDKFGGCRGANLQYDEKYLIFEIKNCGRLTTQDTAQPLVSSHMRFLWPKSTGKGIHEHDDPGSLEGSMYSIDGKSATMEVQIFFHPGGREQSYQKAAIDDELRVVCFFLQTDVRLMNNPKLDRLMQYVEKISETNPKVPVSSAKLVLHKLMRKKTEINPYGPSKKMPGLFDAFYRAFSTQDKRVFKFVRKEFTMRDKKIKATVYVIDTAVPISPEQVSIFQRVVSDYQAPHRDENEKGLDVDVIYGDKRGK